MLDALKQYNNQCQDHQFQAQRGNGSGKTDLYTFVRQASLMYCLLWDIVLPCISQFKFLPEFFNSPAISSVILIFIISFIINGNIIFFVYFSSKVSLNASPRDKEALPIYTEVTTMLYLDFSFIFTQFFFIKFLQYFTERSIHTFV